MYIYERIVRFIDTLPILRSYPVVKQFLKFGIVGVSNLFVDFAVYITLTRGTSYFARHFLLANACSFGVAVTWSYVINRVWTFRNTHYAIVRQYIVFLCINIIALGFNEALLYIFVVYVGLYDLVAKFVAACMVIFWNFFANRYWTFKAHQSVYSVQDREKKHTPLVE